MKVGTDGVLLGAWADVTGVKHVLDVGTGTGVIAIMLGQRTESAMITGIDIDEQACEQAENNAQRAPWAKRLRIICQPVQDFARTHQGEFDLILSNPPFFTGGTFSDRADRNQVRHTIKLPHGDLLSAVRTMLDKSGRFGIILPLIEGLRFQELANTYSLYCTRMTEVRPKADKPVARLLMEFERQEKEVMRDTLVIQQQERNNWTEAYKALTRDFYLNM